jgi:hypothetical protein
MFRTRRALEGIEAGLRQLDARFDQLVDELRTQHELDREVNRREHQHTRAAFGQVSREIVLELRDHRAILERIDHGVEANAQGLMHVLDELRNGRGGPGTAPAT